MTAVPPQPPQRTAAPLPKPPKRKARPDRVLIRPWPKIIAYYPAVLTALICGLVNQFVPGSEEIVAAIFIIVFFFTTVIVGLEFPRMTAFTVILLVAVLILGAVLLNRYLGIIGFLSNLLSQIHLQANSQFYFFIAGIYLFVFAMVWIATRFDYWEVTPNELLHHHGPFADLERFPAPQLKLDKEITDIFEYLLLGSGRLIMHPATERRAIVLDSVLRIKRVEDRIKYLLGAMEVRIDTEIPPQP